MMVVLVSLNVRMFAEEGIAVSIQRGRIVALKNGLFVEARDAPKFQTPQVALHTIMMCPVVHDHRLRRFYEWRSSWIALIFFRHRLVRYQS